MMQNLKILNTRQIKRILGMLELHWGFSEKLDYAFLETEKGKIYIANREIFDLDISELKVNSVGIYFADTRSGIRLSIEGSQIVGPKAKKNVVELDEKEARQWMEGNDLDRDAGESFVILKHGNDFIGSGKATKEGRILNFVPKNRRLR